MEIIFFIKNQIIAKALKAVISLYNPVVIVLAILSAISGFWFIAATLLAMFILIDIKVE